ncbi:PD-(D/E)XK nuclease family protein (plasmid) [Cetobacterium somerae]|uniref:PD-(D/E)XK nuclease family protein n=1 Tax=Cetobacterium somerae TaxID=188913 RepID=UPI002E7B11C4|nr:PD-(D/E)XK nuclease family protein [Cetobacterium somerae]WVJ03340.1 PD-(D/E)XK nuclease family protein [Cetobacterium somerae]
MRPNIFKYATSELSQDALICYVLSYYDEIFKETYSLEYLFAEKFLYHIMEKVGLKNLQVKKLKLEKQVLAIDILLIINDSIYIIIEDKTFTSERENQMNGYREKVINKYKVKEENVYCIYYKTGDESYSNLYLIQQGKNTYTILREEIISLFKKYEGNNIIHEDYLLNLIDIQNEKESFKDRDLRIESFNWSEIIGFYNELDKSFLRLKQEGIMPKDIGFNWHYTANKQGGFMCYYFENVLNFQKYSYYLQLEFASDNDKKKTVKNNLKFVIKVWSCDKDISLLYKGLDILIDNYGDTIVKPSRFARGSWMTQAIIKNYLVINEVGIIDVYKTAINIVSWLNSLRSLKKKLIFDF